MTYTSPSTINASRGIISILEYINEVTEFWISRMIALAIFVIFFAGYLRSKSDDDFIGAFAIGSYATLVVTLLFWIIGFLDGVTFSIVIAGAVISSILLLLDKRGQ